MIKSNKPFQLHEGGVIVPETTDIRIHIDLQFKGNINAYAHVEVPGSAIQPRYIAIAQNDEIKAAYDNLLNLVTAQAIDTLSAYNPDVTFTNSTEEA